MKIIIILLIITMCYGCEDRKIISEKYTLMSLKGKNVIKGTFSIGLFHASGGQEEKSYYTGYVKTGKGLWRFKIPVYKTFLHEGYSKPYLIRKDSHRWVERCFECFNWAHEYHLYIPKNTIIQKFDVSEL